MQTTISRPVTNGIELTPEERIKFRSQVRHGAVESCWEWQGYIPRDREYGRFAVYRPARGYGRHTINYFVHRVAWFLANGPIPEDKPLICHSCDNPRCCNPAHLFPGTAKDNYYDMKKKGREKHVKHGIAPWARGEQSKLSKVTEAQVRDIRRRHAAGTRMKALAIEHSISECAVSLIINRKTWKHVADEPANVTGQ